MTTMMHVPTWLFLLALAGSFFAGWRLARRR